MSQFGTDTREFSRRLKRQPPPEDMETLTRAVTNGAEEIFDPKQGISNKQYQRMAYRMAKKTFEDEKGKNFTTRPKTSPGMAAIRRKIEERKAKGGRGYQITSATMHYVGDVAVTGAKGICFPRLVVFLANSMQ